MRKGILIGLGLMMTAPALALPQGGNQCCGKGGEAAAYCDDWLTRNYWWCDIWWDEGCTASWQACFQGHCRVICGEEPPPMQDPGGEALSGLPADQASAPQVFLPTEKDAQIAGLPPGPLGHVALGVMACAVALPGGACCEQNGSPGACENCCYDALLQRQQTCHAIYGPGACDWVSGSIGLCLCLNDALQDAYDCEGTCGGLCTLEP